MIRIGVVPYINALPLCTYLEHPFIKKPPAVLAQMMEEGKLDIALLPTFASFEHSEYIPLFEGGIIQSFGPVDSVALFLRNDIKNIIDIKNIFITSESKTSINLLKVLLKHNFSIEWKNLAQVQDPQTADALLLIGDTALEFVDTHYWKIDLGKEWTEWTRLPFVYAFWVARSKEFTHFLPVLKEAREKGKIHLDQIIDSIGSLSHANIRHYLTQCIQYEFSPESLRGIEKFRELSKTLL